jgi:hypothetical protein
VEVIEFQRLYPSFQLKDELLLKGGGDVMTGMCYERCRGKNRVAAKQGKPTANPIVPPGAAADDEASN